MDFKTFPIVCEKFHFGMARSFVWKTGYSVSRIQSIGNQWLLNRNTIWYENFLLIKAIFFKQNFSPNIRDLLYIGVVSAADFELFTRDRNVSARQVRERENWIKGVSNPLCSREHPIILQSFLRHKDRSSQTQTSLLANERQKTTK